MTRENQSNLLGALHKQLDKRKFDYSEIGDEGSMFLKSKIKLKENVIKKINKKLDINPDQGLWAVIPD